MKVNPIILVAGSIVSFVLVFFVMAFAMGFMKHGPGALMGSLLGKTPAAVETAGASGDSTDTHHAAPGEAGHDVAGAPAGIGSGSGSHEADAVADAAVAGEAAGTPAHAGTQGMAEDGGHAMNVPDDAAFLSRAEALTRIEEALNTRQVQMEEEKKHLLTLQKELEATNTRLDSLEDEAVQHLARVYSSMRPETAAEIMMRLPPSLQTAIVAKMEDKSAGKVLGAMDPRAAARVSANLGGGK